MDKKAKISLPIKSILVVVITQIVIYLLNLIQIDCDFSSTDYNILIFDKTISTKLGDFDGDDIVDILDVVKLRKHLAGVE